MRPRPRTESCGRRSGHALGARLATHTVAVAHAVRRLLSTWEPDVVHGSAAEAGLLSFVLPPGMALAATSHHPDPTWLPARLPRGPRSISVLHGLQNPYLEAHLLRSAHRVVTTSQWRTPCGSEGTSRRPVPWRWSATGSPMTGSSGGRAPPSPRSAASILFMGRLDRSKGWDILVEALARPDVPRGVTLTMAGTGPDRNALRERARELGLADRIDLLGWLDPPALRARLENAAAAGAPLAPRELSARTA